MRDIKTDLDLLPLSHFLYAVVPYYRYKVGVQKFNFSETRLWPAFGQQSLVARRADTLFTDTLLTDTLLISCLTSHL